MSTLYHELTINPIFRDLIPPPSDDERKLLEESIVQSGCHTAIEIWNGTIIDGHNRYEICTRLRLPFQTRELFFKDDEEAKVYILTNQLARRNLSSAVKGDLAWQRAGLIEQRAKVRVTANLPSQASVAERLHWGDGEETGRTSNVLSSQTGIPERTLIKIKRVRDSGNDEIRDKMLKGEISINKAEQLVSPPKSKPEVKTCNSCKQELPASAFFAGKATCKECIKENASAIDSHLLVTPPPEGEVKKTDFTDEQYELLGLCNDFYIETNKFGFMPRAFDEIGRDSEIFESIEKVINRMTKIKSFINGGK